MQVTFSVSALAVEDEPLKPPAATSLLPIFVPPGNERSDIMLAEVVNQLSATGSYTNVLLVVAGALTFTLGASCPSCLAKAATELAPPGELNGLPPPNTQRCFSATPLPGTLL